MKRVFNTLPEMTPVDPIKILYNIGGMMDIPTGEYVRGIKGENIMNGGLGNLGAVVGKPNMFKSTLAHFMTLMGASRVASAGYAPYINTLDSESNISVNRLVHFSRQIPEFKDHDIVLEKMWMITDQTKHMGEEWYSLLKNYLRNEKFKNKKDYTFQTPFIDREGKQISTLFPSYGQLDSLSKFMTSDVEEMQNKNEIGSSGGNTIYMRQGLGKARLIMELPMLCNSTAHYMMTTAHVGKNTTMMQVGGAQLPVKQLQHMRQDEAIKGAPSDFFFLTTNCWQVTHSTAIINKESKTPEYPKTKGDKEEDITDLNKITVKLLRNKSGPSGRTINLIVSQSEGILPHLSEFDFIKEANRYGLSGNNTTYRSILYPEPTLQRTSIREQLDNIPELRRAIKITADMLQIKQIYKALPLEIPPLEELYAKLEKQYGWKKLLNTRDHWTFNQYDHEVPFLSTLDILEMYHDKLVPYWLK